MTPGDESDRGAPFNEPTLTVPAPTLCGRPTQSSRPHADRNKVAQVIDHLVSETHLTCAELTKERPLGQG
ncbi:MAG: hypothetical protein ACRDRH_28815 [Pseudonocardia sp.]